MSLSNITSVGKQVISMSVLSQIWIKDGQERLSKLYVFDKEILSSCH